MGLLDEVGAHIQGLEALIFAEVDDNPDAQLLMSIPGVGRIVAYTFLAEKGRNVITAARGGSESSWKMTEDG